MPCIAAGCSLPSNGSFGPTRLGGDFAYHRTAMTESRSKAAALLAVQMGLNRTCEGFLRRTVARSFVMDEQRRMIERVVGGGS